MKLKYMFGMAAVAAMTVMTSCSGNNAEKAETEEVNEEAAEAVTLPDSVAVEDVKETWIPDSALVTASGLGVYVENPGGETHPSTTTPVTVHYRGRLTNGKVFDSSYDRGEPATFMPAQVVPGFAEGLMMLGKGGKATLYIPGNLAYGPAGVPQAGIGPDENLIFDIEIIDFPEN